VIDTREELVNALSEAAELEHGLLIQYLFAAFSLKRRVDEGITPVQQSLIVDWERTVLRVAHEEMYHLASVCNLLSAIGGASQFGRPNFPQPTVTSLVEEESYYPFDFQLERFNDSTLYRFVIFELPEGETPPEPPEQPDLEGIGLRAAPDPLVYSHVGELYSQIREGFERIPEDVLFIGPKPYQDVEDWGLRMKIHVVKDLPSAQEAIEAIVIEGEGSPGAREGSHYDRFLKIREGLRKERQKHPRFDPARPVVLNPQTRRHRDAGEGATLIAHEVTREVAELFNDIYSTMLLMLIQYYSYGGESTSQRRMLRDSCRRMMSAVVRPLAEVLTEMPATNEPEGGNAGPGFEIYSGMRLAPDRTNRWTVLQERLRQEVEDSRALAQYAGSFPVLARLRRVEEAMQGTLLNLTTEFGEG
jgi:Ferritin-like